jgi:hypothetical protein
MLDVQHQGIVQWSHIQLQAFCEFTGVREDFSTLERCKSSKRSSIEPREFKAETSVHTVGCQFESHLFNVVLVRTLIAGGEDATKHTHLKELCGGGGSILHQGFDLATTIDKGSNETR